jgi:signal transduction histidine kinase
MRIVAVLAAIAVQSTIVEPDRFPVSGIAAMVCATFSLGAHAALRTAATGLAIAALGAGVHAAVFYPGGEPPAILGGVVVPWVAGRTVRTRRELTAELHDKAARLEEAREEEARAAVVAERARVARELHDAVAHSLSVIAIQAAGAAGIADRDPDRAARSSDLIEAVGGDALAELRRLAAPTGADAPGLEGVGALTQRARAGGLPVELRIEGEPAALPAGVDLAAFRIVQEALANVSKHARAARAWVVVRYERDAVEVEVADDGRGPNGAAPASGGGHGLVGMRERVALYNGMLEAGGRPDGGFLVRARLPL